MFAHVSRKRFHSGLVASFAIVLLVSFFSLGRIVNTSLNPSSLKDLPEAPQRNDSLALRKLSDSRTADSDEDGLPDSVELTSAAERENFRRWFTAIAEMQFYRLSDQWLPDQRDCAGLARFAWREALRNHDRLWFQRMGPGYDQVGPDVGRYSLEHGPLGEKLFRTAFGAYKETDLASGKFSEFADARTLKAFNTKFISRDRQAAEPGDLLFFYQPWVQKFPFHVMIFLGQARFAAEGANDWVVYHTGSSALDEGTVKKVRLSVLDQHPNKRWRPVESNPNFIGFYRLKILE
jgi:uncharacterized protein YfaT (DUF1175 family)